MTRSVGREPGLGEMTKATFRLEYEVGKAGWARCSVGFGDQTANMVVSYLHDSLKQLCDVVAAVAEGARTGAVLFMDEPGEHELLLERLGDSLVQVRIVWYDDWKSWGSDSEGRLVLRGDTTVDDLRAEVVSATRHILESLGEAEYRRRWTEHDFPTDSYNRLRGAG
jgi:hypothetical protein